DRRLSPSSRRADRRRQGGIIPRPAPSRSLHPIPALARPCSPGQPMARRWTPLPLLAALLLSRRQKGARAAPAAPAAPPAPPGAAAPVAPAAPGQAAVPVGTGMPGFPPGLAPSPAPAFDVSKLPNVVARVNGIEIKREELLARAAGMRQQ